VRRIRLVAYGRVQGVGFRDYVRGAARDIGRLRGYVRNRADGAVEIEAEGDPDRLQRLRDRVQQGPSWATVSRIEELPPGEGPLPDVFEIAR
jgi:acylphosphatase